MRDKNQEPVRRINEWDSDDLANKVDIFQRLVVVHIVAFSDGPSSCKFSLVIKSFPTGRPDLPSFLFVTTVPQPETL